MTPSTEAPSTAGAALDVIRWPRITIRAYELGRPDRPVPGLTVTIAKGDVDDPGDFTAESPLRLKTVTTDHDGVAAFDPPPASWPRCFLLRAYLGSGQRPVGWTGTAGRLDPWRWRAEPRDPYTCAQVVFDPQGPGLDVGFLVRISPTPGMAAPVEPVVNPVAEPVVDLVAEPLAQPAAEPVVESGAPPPAPAPLPSTGKARWAILVAALGAAAAVATWSFAHYVGSPPEPQEPEPSALLAPGHLDQAKGQVGAAATFDQRSGACPGYPGRLVRPFIFTLDHGRLSAVQFVAHDRVTGAVRPDGTFSLANRSESYDGRILGSSAVAHYHSVDPRDGCAASYDVRFVFGARVAANAAVKALA